MTRPFDFSDVVRTHHRGAKAFLVADSPDARQVQASYVEAIGPNRQLVALDFQALDGLRPEQSWVAGVILARGDDARPIARWVSVLRADGAERVHFYLLPGVHAVRAFRAWYAERLDDPRTADIEGWRSMRPSFGLAFSNQAYLDAKRHPEWFPKRG